VNVGKWIGVALIALGMVLVPFLYRAHGKFAALALVLSVIGFFLARDRKVSAAAMGITGPESSGEARGSG
jgi:membrane-bound ClpP family serine protease